jgi:hypothetical protein
VLSWMYKWGVKWRPRLSSQSPRRAIRLVSSEQVLA